MDVSEYEFGDDEFGLAMAACVTVIPGDVVAAIRRIFGSDAGSSCGVVSIDADGQGDCYQAWHDGKRTVVLESNGYWGSIAENLSKAGIVDAESVFWNVNSQMRYLELRSGETVREFDPLFRHPEPDSDDEPEPGVGVPYPEEDSLPFAESPEASALALLATRTGADIRIDTLRSPRETWVAPPA